MRKLGSGFGEGQEATDEKVVVFYADHLVAPDTGFELTLDDGQALAGRSDAQGATPLVQKPLVHGATLKLLPDQ
jgi:hypothetical protein